MKSKIIRVRVSEELYNDILSYSRTKDKSVSDFVREALWKDMRGTLNFNRDHLEEIRKCIREEYKPTVSELKRYIRRQLERERRGVEDREMPAEEKAEAPVKANFSFSEKGDEIPEEIKEKFYKTHLISKTSVSQARYWLEENVEGIFYDQALSWARKLLRKESREF